MQNQPYNWAINEVFMKLQRKEGCKKLKFNQFENMEILTFDRHFPNEDKGLSQLNH